MSHSQFSSLPSLQSCMPSLCALTSKHPPLQQANWPALHNSLFSSAIADDLVVACTPPSGMLKGCKGVDVVKVTADVISRL